MFRLVVVFVISTLAKSALGHLAYSQPLLAASPAVVTSSSSQFIGRNYNAIAAPFVASPAITYAAVPFPVRYSGASTFNSFAKLSTPIFSARLAVPTARFIPAVQTAAVVSAAPVLPATPVVAASRTQGTVGASTPVTVRTETISAPTTIAAAPTLLQATKYIHPLAPLLTLAPPPLPSSPVTAGFLAYGSAVSPVSTPVAAATSPHFTGSITGAPAFTAFAYNGQFVTPIAAAVSPISAGTSPLVYATSYLPSTEGSATASSADASRSTPSTTTYAPATGRSLPEEPVPTDNPVNSDASNSFDSQASLPDARNPEPDIEGARVYGPPQLRAYQSQQEGSISRSDSSSELLKYTDADRRAKN